MKKTCQTCDKHFLCGVNAKKVCTNYKSNLTGIEIPTKILPEFAQLIMS